MILNSHKVSLYFEEIAYWYATLFENVRIVLQTKAIQTSLNFLYSTGLSDLILTHFNYTSIREDLHHAKIKIYYIQSLIYSIYIKC